MTGGQHIGRRDIEWERPVGAARRDAVAEIAPTIRCGTSFNPASP